MQYVGMKISYNADMPLPTGEKVRKVGKAFPTFIYEALMLQMTTRNRAQIPNLHLNDTGLNIDITMMRQFS